MNEPLSLSLSPLLLPTTVLLSFPRATSSCVCVCACICARGILRMHMHAAAVAIYVEGRDARNYVAGRGAINS